MPKGRSSGRGQEKKRQRRQKRLQKRGSSVKSSVQSKSQEKIDLAYRLINRKDYETAEEILESFQGRRSAQVEEAWVYFCQSIDDNERGSWHASKLLNLRPGDVDAQMMFAQFSMFCGRACVAMRTYREVLKKWPESPHASKAQAALEFLQDEVDDRLMEHGLPDDRKLELYALHETTVGLMQSGHFGEAIECCRTLITAAPEFVSPHNNLTILLYRFGQLAEAIEHAEATVRRFPENAFAKTELANLWFLTGRQAEAGSIVDELLDDLPDQQDPLCHLLGLLALMGRDEAILKIMDSPITDVCVDSAVIAMLTNLRAYAHARLGQLDEAKRHWKSIRNDKRLASVAQENLRDLKSSIGHAPWFASLESLLPQALVEKFVGQLSHKQSLESECMKSIVPVLLDRGNPIGREFAFRFAQESQEPSMIAALKEFAAGPRGPDGMRLEALQFLVEQGELTGGPHSIWLNGQQHSEDIIIAEIFDEPVDNSESERICDLLHDATIALYESDFETAEQLLEEILAEEPQNPTANYNLCVVWLQRDGKAGKERALARMEEIRQFAPDYLFAAVTLAQFKHQQGEWEEAKELIKPFYSRRRLHISEAKAIYVTRAEMEFSEGRIENAERMLDMLTQLVDDDDAQVQALRNRFARQSRLNSL